MALPNRLASRMYPGLYAEPWMRGLWVIGHVLRDHRMWPCGCSVVWTLRLVAPAMTPIWMSSPHLCPDHAAAKVMPKPEEGS